MTESSDSDKPSSISRRKFVRVGAVAALAASAVDARPGATQSLGNPTTPGSAASEGNELRVRIGGLTRQQAKEMGEQLQLQSLQITREVPSAEKRFKLQTPEFTARINGDDLKKLFESGAQSGRVFLAGNCRAKTTSSER